MAEETTQKKKKPVVSKRGERVAPVSAKPDPEDLVKKKPTVRGRNIARQEPAYKVPWAKGVDHPAGEEIQKRFYGIGIYTVADLKEQKAAASRIVAEAFKGEVSNLIRFGLSIDHVPVPEPMPVPVTEE